MRLAVTSAVTVLVLIIVILELLRRRQLREKYAVLWLSTIVLILPVAIYPRLVDTMAVQLGIASGASLVLFLAVVFLLVVCIHLSWEVSRLEEETRTLAEQIALVRTELSLGHQHPTASSAASTEVAGK